MESNRRYTPIQQYSILKAMYGGKGTVLPSKFTWMQEFTPTPVSNTYKIKIQYSQGDFPQTFIVSPKPLPLAPGANRLPHTYDTKKQRLCLFTPKFGEWNSTMKIATTIVHWAVQWMLFYESWCYTGVWLGGGHGNWDSIPSDDKINHT